MSTTTDHRAGAQPSPLHYQHHDDSSPASSSAPVSAGPSRQGHHIDPPARVGKGKSVSRERGRSSMGTQSVEPEDPNKPKDRHEPRGRKPNDQLPPSRAREVQRAFRLRRAEHLAALEERINLLEAENSQLRALLSLPEAERERIGSGPTGRGKSLKEGGVPMSERVRARKEARARERRLLGLPEPADDSSGGEEGDTDHTPNAPHKRLRQDSTMSPRAAGTPSLPSLAVPQNSLVRANGQNGSSHTNGQASTNNGLPTFQMPQPPESSSSFAVPSYGGMSFDMTLPSAENPFGDFESAIFKNLPSSSAGPNFAAMFGLYDETGSNTPTGSSSHHQSQGHGTNPNGTLAQPAPHFPRNVSGTGSNLGRSPISPPASAAPGGTSPSTSTGTNGNPAAQPDLLVRLRQCCHLSDSHVVNDPGLLIFATRLCQSFPCQFSGAHAEGGVAISDSEHLLLDDSWKLLRNQLDPGTELDGEHRINTGRMAAELVIRAAHSRGPGGWIVCRYTQGMSVKRALVAGLIQGLGGQFE